MNKLTAKQLVMINQKLTGNTKEISQKTRLQLEEIAQIPYEQNEMSLYVYKGIIPKASRLGCAIANIKPFEEKNNQTALLAALTLLELNDIKLNDYEEDLSQLAEHFASGDIERGCEWMKERRITNEMI